MLAGELAGDLVEAAHPLHGDQERLVAGQARVLQVGDLVAQVILQLVDVDRADRLMPLDVAAPAPDLRLELGVRASAPSLTWSCRRRASLADGLLRRRCRAPRRRPSHCSRRSASASRPAGVIA